MHITYGCVNWVSIALGYNSRSYWLKRSCQTLYKFKQDFWCIRKMSQKMKERAKNFSEREKSNIINIVEKYLDVIENKKTDCTTTQSKNEAWQKVAKNFNASNNIQRTAEQIKNCYLNLKKKVKKDTANEKVELYKTGGGGFKKIVNETGERMLGMLSSQFQPLSNPFDSSAIYLENSCTAIDNTNTNEQNDNILVEIDESVTTDNLNELPLASVSPKISVPPYLNKVPFTSSSAVKNTNKRKRNSILDDILKEKQEQASVKKQKLECEVEHQNKFHLAQLETEEIDKKLKLYELEEICPLRKEKELIEISIKDTEKRIKLMELKIKELEYKMLLKKYESN